MYVLDTLIAIAKPICFSQGFAEHDMGTNKKETFAGEAMQIIA